MGGCWPDGFTDDLGNGTRQGPSAGTIFRRDGRFPEFDTCQLRSFSYSVSVSLSSLFSSSIVCVYLTKKRLLFCTGDTKVDCK